MITTTRRKYERVGFLCRVDVADAPGGRAVPGSTIDISLGGVGITIRSAFQVGATVEVAFFLKDRAGADAVERVPGRVARFDADPDGNRLGVEFLEPLQAARFPVLTRRVERL
jgi:c-di-GMP-binding flagellar brake protein YcgR